MTTTNNSKLRIHSIQFANYIQSTFSNTPITTTCKNEDYPVVVVFNAENRSTMTFTFKPKVVESENQIYEISDLEHIREVFSTIESDIRENLL